MFVLQFLRFLQVVLGFGHESSLLDQVDRRVLLKEDLFGFSKELSVRLSLDSPLHFFGVNLGFSRMSFTDMASKRFWLSESSLTMITLHRKVNEVLLGVDVNLSRLLWGLDRCVFDIE